MRRGIGAAAALATVLCAAPARTNAFCGFYVSGADGALTNKATQVVLMREGMRTVLSMSNSYEGPPEDFAMIVPVPVVLQRQNVVTLDRALFDRVDRLAAPRLVEYWEQDPCMFAGEGYGYGGLGLRGTGRGGGGSGEGSIGLGVRIEAQFAVGEYDVVILSADDSVGLDTWLRQERYNIPRGAEAVLRPYVQAGTKFFVARVDVARVHFENGRAILSPLRFHYDAEQFSLPVRLGLLNSAGAQDLIVHILARGQRYEVANYPNVTIPTNVQVANAVRDRFGSFYAALFDRTIAENPRAVVTEYAWEARNCDPCPVPPLDTRELGQLGASVLPPATRGDGFVLTRLHYRYSSDTLGEDLVFREATPIMGGREVEGAAGRIERRGRPGDLNNFQARYIIRHYWRGPIRCAHPTRGVWGGPPDGRVSATRAATNLAFVQRRGVRLERLIRHRIPELRLRPEPRRPPATPPAGAPRGSVDAPAVLGGAAMAGVVAVPVVGVVVGSAVRRLRRRRKPHD